jgi:DNA N-6-adenine-methyltransferase (Dam)
VPILTYGRFHRDGGYEFSTPQSLFQIYDRRFHFTRDVCASKYNAKCRIWISKKTDALMVPWRGTCWMNPPFARLYDWISKAHRSAQEGATVVALIPAWTSEKWFHEFCCQSEVILLRDLAHFNNQSSAFPYAMMIVVFRPNDALLSVRLAHHAMRDPDAVPTKRKSRKPNRTLADNLAVKLFKEQEERNKAEDREFDLIGRLKALGQPIPDLTATPPARPIPEGSRMFARGLKYQYDIEALGRFDLKAVGKSLHIFDQTGAYRARIWRHINPAGKGQTTDDEQRTTYRYSIANQSGPGHWKTMGEVIRYLDGVLK